MRQKKKNGKTKEDIENISFHFEALQNFQYKIKNFSYG
jgi:hypothetical protein